LAIVGIIPVLWMQLIRPFYIFSILVLSLPPEQLSPEQRQILTLFKTRKHQLLSCLASVLILLILWEIEHLAPLAASIVSFIPQWRILGLLLAIVGLWTSNLFLQIPVSVFGVLINSQEKFAATEPYPVEKIASEFTIPGWQVEKILANIIVESNSKNVS
jgi:hypothetical protein